MSVNLPSFLTDTLLWSAEFGMGWHTRPPMTYEGPYFEKYLVMDAAPMGAELTAARVDMVRRHTDLPVVDIGIGGGRFVTESGGFGFDVNADAVAWLNERDAYFDPYKSHCEVITCWDSLEHIPDPVALIDRVSEWVFVAMPIYKDLQDCLNSKHYRPGEHIWYWTHQGLILWFHNIGFECVEVNDQETTIGREGIKSYAFKRVAK